MSNNKVKLLLVDDSSSINEMNKYFFEKSLPGVMIQTSRNGQEALNYLGTIGEEENPDLIVLDLKMPVVDGLEFLETLRITRSEEELDRTKVILLSTSMNPEDKRKVKQYSFVVEYFVKPLSIYQVKSIVEEYLS